MKIASPCFAAALGIAFALTTNLAAQQSAGSPPPAHEHEHGHGPMPPPTNLQVLPKTMTGEQVHEMFATLLEAFAYRFSIFDASYLASSTIFVYSCEPSVSILVTFSLSRSLMLSMMLGSAAIVWSRVTV